ncbi:hypothetical protein NI389_20065 (plasmid) [Pseudoalteromonas xiamenensis]|uniref:hypothetical protein n=1 Tax=Pseudoalteromonas xiamenensis TaxID=882626 RepID=UPI0027E52779|nr:hypothetical protein [Pseudoalteromonas xiamenensis]WMN62096.1 hypothetical protein NI389_20065 [Pseudoalteromonas xiamenensis]
MKRFYKHPVKPEWGFTCVDLDECNDEFESFLFSDVGEKKLKVSIAKANLVELDQGELNAIDPALLDKLKGFSRKELFSAKAQAAKKEEKDNDDDIEFDDIDLGDEADWLDEEEEVED